MDCSKGVGEEYQEWIRVKGTAWEGAWGSLLGYGNVYLVLWLVKQPYTYTKCQQTEHLIFA